MCVIATPTWSLRTVDAASWVLECMHLRRLSPTRPWSYSERRPFGENTRVSCRNQDLGQRRLKCLRSTHAPRLEQENPELQLTSSCLALATNTHVCRNTCVSSQRKRGHLELRLRTANWILEHRHVRRRSTAASWGSFRSAVPFWRVRACVLQKPGSLGQQLACFA